MEGESISAKNYVALPKKSIVRFAKSICKIYGIPQVEIHFRNLGQWTAEWMEPNIITLGRKNNSKGIVTIAHELAHHLHNSIAGMDKGHQDHGPEYMACYMSILDTSRIIPVVGMRAICDSYKSKDADPGTKNSLSALRRAVLGYASSHPG